MPLPDATVFAPYEAVPAKDAGLSNLQGDVLVVKVKDSLLTKPQAGWEEER